jgi:hypothetical protein
VRQVSSWAGCWPISTSCRDQHIEKYANYIGIALLLAIAVLLVVRHQRSKAKK